MGAALVGDAELLVDGAGVGLDGAGGDAEPGRDGAVAQPVGDQREDLGLAVGEAGQRGTGVAGPARIAEKTVRRGADWLIP